MDAVPKKSLLRILAFFVLLSFLSAATAWTSETRKFYVKMPSACYEVKKVEGSNVYLKSTEKTCMQAAVKREIAIDSSIKKVSIYVDGKFWTEQDIEDFNMNSIRDLKKGANDLFDNLKVPENEYKDMAGKYAVQTKQYYESEAFQKKCNAEAERLKATIFKDQHATLYRMEQFGGVKAEHAQIAKMGDRLIAYFYAEYMSSIVNEFQIVPSCNVG